MMTRDPRGPFLLMSVRNTSRGPCGRRNAIALPVQGGMGFWSVVLPDLLNDSAAGEKGLVVPHKTDTRSA